MSLGAFLDRISDWADAWRERTWLIHGTLLVPITLALWPVMVALQGRPVAQASAGGVAFYLWRELEQIAHEVMEGRQSDWLDHLLDVVSPAIVAVLLALIEAAFR